MVERDLIWRDLWMDLLDLCILLPKRKWYLGGYYDARRRSARSFHVERLGGFS